MNIRSKKKGKAVYWIGDNFEEILDTFEMWSWAEERFNTFSPEDTLEKYITEAEVSGTKDSPRPLVYAPRDGVKRAFYPPSYIVEMDGDIFCMSTNDFNKYFEEDLTI